MEKDSVGNKVWRAFKRRCKPLFHNYPLLNVHILLIIHTNYTLMHFLQSSMLVSRFIYDSFKKNVICRQYTSYYWFHLSMDFSLLIACSWGEVSVLISQSYSHFHPWGRAHCQMYNVRNCLAAFSRIIRLRLDACQPINFFTACLLSAHMYQELRATKHLLTMLKLSGILVLLSQSRIPLAGPFWGWCKTLACPQEDVLRMISRSYKNLNRTVTTDD